MRTNLSITPRSVMAQHQETLTEYARQVLVHGRLLGEAEAADLSFRMREYMTVGIGFKCTEKELVTVLYKCLFQRKPGCDCVTCRHI